MSSQSVHAITGRTLRHWTINRREFVGGAQRPSPPMPFSEPEGGGQFERVASKLAEIKAELTRRADAPTRIGSQ